VSDSLKLSVYSPQRKLIESREVESVSLTGSEGQIQVLPGHAQMAGTLDTGPFAYSEKGQEVRGVISTGFFEVIGNDVIVLAETLELGSEIDYERAKLAQKKSEDALKDLGLAQDQFRKHQLKLQRSLIRQQVAAKKLSNSDRT
jgi:F-type H+-transporting ATPase subunit epsilon